MTIAMMRCFVRRASACPPGGVIVGAAFSSPARASRTACWRSWRELRAAREPVDRGSTELPRPFVLGDAVVDVELALGRGRRALLVVAAALVRVGEHVPRLVQLGRVGLAGVARGVEPVLALAVRAADVVDRRVGVDAEQ